MKNKKTGRKNQNNNNFIIAMAYFSRYYVIVSVFLGLVFQKEILAGLVMIAFAIHWFVGYKLKWQHIYCAYQNAYHEKMTPDSANWSHLKKSDMYGLPALFFIMGLALILVMIKK